MSKGVIYVMTTVVPGLIKIGKTGSSNFESRMYHLEHNGYSNVVGLKRYFAIEVDDYDEKEMLLDDIFSKSRVENTELFALDVNLVVQLLSSFEGTQVYPTDITKAETFTTASNQRDISVIPEGTYYLSRKVKRWNNRTVEGTIEVKNGKITILKGSTVCPVITEIGSHKNWVTGLRKTAVIKDNVLVKDCVVDSPSAAGAMLIGGACNGWTNWRTSDGKKLDVYRNGQQ